MSRKPRTPEHFPKMRDRAAGRHTRAARVERREAIATVQSVDWGKVGQWVASTIEGFTEVVVHAATDAFDAFTRALLLHPLDRIAEQYPNPHERLDASREWFGRQIDRRMDAAARRVLNGHHG